MKRLLLMAILFTFISCSLEKFERPETASEEDTTDNTDLEHDLTDDPFLPDSDIEADDEYTAEIEGVVCTGQTKCYDDNTEIECPNENSNYYGQDGQYSTDNLCVSKSFSIKDNGSGPVAIDNNTHLEWQQMFYLRKYEWDQAVENCKDLNYGGFDDWRLPTYEELWTIIDLGAEESPAINTDVFPFTPADSFWTSSEDPLDNEIGWTVDFIYGGTRERYKNSSHYARCVRGPKLSLNNNFSNKTIRNDRIIVDSTVNLIWTDTQFTNKNWKTALMTCESLNYGGKANWRLPNISELKTLVNITKQDPASDMSGITSQKLWSSTTDSMYYDFYGLTVDFERGTIEGTVKTENADVLCVTGENDTNNRTCFSDKGCPEERSCIGGKCALPDSFISKWTTTYDGYSDENSIKLPLVDNGTYNFTVYWGDGTENKITKWNDPALLHRYNKKGTYTIVIEGDISGWQFCNFNETEEKCENSDSGKITEIIQWGTFSFGKTEFQFSGCYNLEIKAADLPDLSETESLRGAFQDCYILVGTDFFKNLNVSGIKNMGDMFNNARIFNQDISGWNVSKVTDMNSMFKGAVSFNQDISGWDVSNVADMGHLFSGAKMFDHDITGWNVSKVTNMSGMFNGHESFNQNISGWNVSKVTDMNSMFKGAVSFNQDISGWDVSNVTDMSFLFNGAISFKGDLTTWNVSNVVNMYKMFSHAYSFDQDISGWNVSNVKYMQEMFYNTTLSTANYDALLNGWSKLILQNSVEFHGGNSKYSSSGETARAKIISDFNWTITDGGLTE
ncbi:MAG TPA: BspA family leucine-rich repeat surface protein [bacterium]|nr:BspA family leucine-rich repeat surface protein [bacterium]